MTMLALAVMSMAASPAMAQDRFDRLEHRLDRFDDGFDFDAGASQDFDQEADSGDVDQSFEVSSDGDNSN